MDKNQQADKIGRRQMLARTAAAGGALWVAPAVLAAPAGASEITGSPEPCSGREMGIFLKLNLDGRVWEPVTGGNCLGGERDAYAEENEIASVAEINCELGREDGPIPPEVTVVTKPGGTDAATVTITLPPGFSPLGAAFTCFKAGSDTFLGSGEVDGQTITFDIAGRTRRGISNVQFGIFGCISEECLECDEAPTAETSTATETESSETTIAESSETTVAGESGATSAEASSTACEDPATTA